MGVSYKKALLLLAGGVIVLASAVAAGLSLDRIRMHEENESSKFGNESSSAIQHRARLDAQQQWLDEVLQTTNIVEISQNDFTAGTVVVAEGSMVAADGSGSSERRKLMDGPLVLRLSEDIVFNPNASSPDLPPHRSGYVNRDQYQFYDPAAYGIGFFAAIAIERQNVVLDLNGFTLEQSREHALQQRFYANIELADQPFIPKQGPANFGGELTAARKVAIINGHIGRASHHGIHGQLPEDVLIQDVTFSDFEVAAVSLHGAKRASLNRVSIDGNSRDVEVLGLYSALRFIQPYIAQLPDDYALDMPSGAVTKVQLQRQLATINDAVVRDDTDWRVNYPFIINETGLIDGNAYGVVFNARGVAVNGFPDQFDEDTAASDVYLQDVTIKDIKADIQEVPALTAGDGQIDGAQADVVGAVLQTYGLVDESQAFVASIETAPIQLAQLMVAKAIDEGVDFGFLPTDKNTIQPAVVDWAEGQLTFADAGMRYVLNGDSMHHVNKGVTVVKLDGTRNALLNRVAINDVDNLSVPCLEYSQIENYLPLNDMELAYDRGASVSVKGATSPGAGMNAVRAISVASSRDVELSEVTVDTVNSSHGPSYGVELLYDSDHINLTGLTAQNLGPNTAQQPADTSNSQPIKSNLSQAGRNIKQ